MRIRAFASLLCEQAYHLSSLVFSSVVRMRSTIFRKELGRHKSYTMLRFAVLVFVVSV